MTSSKRFLCYADLLYWLRNDKGLIRSIKRWSISRGTISLSNLGLVVELWLLCMQRDFFIGLIKNSQYRDPHHCYVGFWRGEILTFWDTALGAGLTGWVHTALGREWSLALQSDTGTNYTSWTTVPGSIFRNQASGQTKWSDNEMSLLVPIQFWF